MQKDTVRSRVSLSASNVDSCTLPRLITHLEASDIMAAKGWLITPERLIELANSGHAPHWRIDGGMPLFHKADICRWVSLNLVEACDGMPLPRGIPVACERAKITDVPGSIAAIPGLKLFPALEVGPGCYFLVRNGAVVYVGQSVNVTSRVAQHYGGEKKFDYVLWLPVPASELDRIEGALIRHLRPELNKSLGPLSDDFALHDIGIETSDALVARYGTGHP